jgi:hypothetical protein
MQMKKAVALVFLSLMLVSLTKGQASFTNIEIKLKTIPNPHGTSIICTGSALAINFHTR